jgi:hypothetical protein
MAKNKILATILLIVSSICVVSAQTVLSLKFKKGSAWENHNDYAVCPGDVEYQVLNWNSSCHTMTVVNGSPGGDVTSSVSSDGKIKINWPDNGDTCWVKVAKKTDAACSEAAPTLNFLIPVLSLAKVKPSIEQIPAGALDVGFIHNVKYVAKAQYPFLGIKDDSSSFKLDEFAWTIPSGWTFNGSAQFDTISVKTDLKTRGLVTAKAYNKKCLGNSGTSAAGELKADRKMPSPCFPGGSLMASQYWEICGLPIMNTINCANLPVGFESPPGGVTYEWSVTPADGWTVISGGTGTEIKYQTDGTKARNIPLRLINPLAEISGNKLFCVKDSFKLTHPIAPGANVTWKVDSLNALPFSISPRSGTGSTAILNVIGGGANYKITFKIKGCNDSVTLSTNFFAGKPIIQNMTIDGKPTNTALVCRGGYHFMSASLSGVLGANVCLQWESLNGHPLNINCNTAQVWMPEASGPPVIAKVTATNECGPTVAYFYLWPGPKCNGLPGFGLAISPNPASDMVSIQVLNKETLAVGLEAMTELYILNQNGSIVFSNNTSQTIHQVQIGQITEGFYTVRAKVGGEIITEPLLIKRQ